MQLILTVEDSYNKEMEMYFKQALNNVKYKIKVYRLDIIKLKVFVLWINL